MDNAIRRFLSVYVVLSVAWLVGVFLVPAIRSLLIGATRERAAPGAAVFAVLAAHVATCGLFFRPLKALTRGTRTAWIVLAAAFPSAFAAVFWMIFGLLLWVVTGAGINVMSFAFTSIFVPFVFVMATYGVALPAGVATVAWLRHVSQAETASPGDSTALKLFFREVSSRSVRLSGHVTRTFRARIAIGAAHRRGGRVRDARGCVRSVSLPPAPWFAPRWPGAA